MKKKNYQKGAKPVFKKQKTQPQYVTVSRGGIRL